MTAVKSPPFRAFTIRFGGLMQRVMTEVSVCAGFDPAKPPAPPPQIIKTTALWDTGASGSCLAPDLVAQLGIASIGKTNVNHAGGASEAALYLVNVLLPNRVQVAGVMATELRGKHDFGAIVGMDIISKGDLVLTHHAGKTCMSFRIPSYEVTDYVAQHDAIVFSGVGRNDPCPCGRKNELGEAVKFKHCHGSAARRSA